MAQNARTGNVKMLEELKIRSLMASYMMFDRSTKYGNYAFRTLILVAILIGVAAANIFDYIPVGDDEDWVSVSKMVIGLVSGFSATIQTGKIFLLEHFEKKEKLYNETAAGWQKLELDIRLFLNYIDTATDEDIKEFTSKCIQDRDNVCTKSKPEGDMYQHYHDDPHVTIKQYRKKQLVIKRIGKRLEEVHNEQLEDIQDDVLIMDCWACFPYGVYWHNLFTVIRYFMSSFENNRCTYHRVHVV